MPAVTDTDFLALEHAEDPSLMEESPTCNGNNASNDHSNDYRGDIAGAPRSWIIG